MSSLLRRIKKAGEHSSGKYQVLLLGAIDSGKTTLLYRAVCNEYTKFTPTNEFLFNLETLTLNNGHRPIELFDLAGDLSYQSLWVRNYDNARGLVFVIDGSHEAPPDEIEDLKRVLATPGHRFTPVLILVNKQDLATVRTLDDVVRSLEMLSERSRLWHIQGCSARTGNGVKEAFEELSKMMRCNKTGQQISDPNPGAEMSIGDNPTYIRF